MNKFFILIFFISLNSTSQAMINLTLTGKILRVNEKTIELQSGPRNYVLLRSKLGTAQEQMVKQSEKNKVVILSVYADAVEDVKNLNP